MSGFGGGERRRRAYAVAGRRAFDYHGVPVELGDVPDALAQEVVGAVVDGVVDAGGVHEVFCEEVREDAGEELGGERGQVGGRGY